MKEKQLCLFCKGIGPFNTVEHIVPESLGNDEDLVSGLICDSCQNYFGRKIEKPALEQTNIAFWRTYLGLKNKKGDLPSIEWRDNGKGRIPANHSFSDDVGFTANDDFSTSVDINNPEMMKEIVEGSKKTFNLVLTPWRLSILGRFIGKMGLEFLALHNLDLAMNSRLDEIRNFVRFGSVNSVWPIYWAQYGDIRDLKEAVLETYEYIQQDVHCYSYSLGKTSKNEYIFAFLIGTDFMMVDLTSRNPKLRLLSVIKNAELNLVWYPDGSWEK